MAENPFGVIAISDAGKDKFSEYLHTRKFLKKVKLRTHGNTWFVYDGRGWNITKSSYYEALTVDLLPERYRSAKHATAVMNLAAMQSQLVPSQAFTGAVRFDKEGRVLINCRNGILRVTASETKLMSHDEELLFTGYLQAEWPGGEWERSYTPLFHKTLDEVLPEVDDQALQQWFAGYLLFPSCCHEVFLISHGKGGSGKSTISDAIMEVIGGKPLKTVLSLAQICAEGQGAYSLPSLQYATVNMGTELDTVDIGDSANFKRLVSGEPVEVRPIYGDPFTMTATTKLWFNSNSLPRFRHGTDAELRRARFLEFIHTPKEKDVTLKERLKAERDGIFAWMVQGLQAILGGMPCPEGSKESVRVKAKFAISNDPVAAFAKECLVFGPEKEMTKEALWESFGDFLAAQGFSEKPRVQLFRQFYERFPTVVGYREKYGKKRAVGQWVLGAALADKDERETA